VKRTGKISAGLLMYRIRNNQLEVFIAHPGGPFFRRHDLDCWTIPKGEVEENESLLHAAIREFTEETGIQPQGPYIELGSIRQKGGKTVHAWAFSGTWDESTPTRSNLFKLEYPPGSGQINEYPELDKVAFLSVEQSRPCLKNAQHPFLTRLEAALNHNKAGIP